MNLESLTTILLPLIGAGAGYLLKYEIDKRQNLIGEVNERRRKMYIEFVAAVIEIIKGVKKDIKMEPISFTDKMYEFYKDYVMFASPSVIRAMSKYYQYLYLYNRQRAADSNVRPDVAQHFMLLTNVMKTMRHDLGLSNSGLGSHGQEMLKMVFADYDKILK